MKKETNHNHRHCSECNREFVPNPWVGARQVTCGRAECQKRRHARKCKEWHQQNREEGQHHYQDVTVPYREKYPDYQRCWRCLHRHGEIREKITAIVRQLCPMVSLLHYLIDGTWDKDLQLPINMKENTQEAISFSQGYAPKD